ncbi:MAG: bifunctional acetaldehyde-CoA/alcohol dehydrogenase [Bacilli bacterium]|jgi:acetaldehyde dehydrogenase / alcohol dehydrogenase|nr:bifunctional acetaldehyde-CoA/alcohol dehydrogenase [Bacilli bacterium]
MDDIEKKQAASDELTQLIAKVRAAQQVYATYTQEQVDKIFQAVAIAANKARIPLAQEAVSETGMGVFEDKVIKNHFAAEYIYNAYKDSKTCDVLERNDDMGYQKLAEPLGILAGIVPTTNPTATVIFKSLLALKTRNGIIFSPHPRAKNCTIHAAQILKDAAIKAGAPSDIISWIPEPSIELSSQLMKSCDCILATGGPGMVTAAYSSGKPAIGVGPGNAPTIIDTSANVKMAVSSIIHSKTFDNGMICASENSIIALDGIYDAVKAELIYRGAYFLNESELNKVRGTILINGSTNAKIVGKPATTIAEMAGFKVPSTTKILVGEVEKTDRSEEFSHEKLCPVLAMYHAKDFEDALAKAEALLQQGWGHTADLYVDELNHPELIDAFKRRMQACRLLINTPSSLGGIGDLYNFRIKPSLTLGCGSWGGNSVSGQVGIENLLNIKTVAIRRENMLWFRTPSKLFFKPGCLSKALEELKTVYDRKRVLIVTDKFLFTSGVVKKLTDILYPLGIETEVFSDVAPDPTLACAEECVKLCNFYQPDAIIALGGGSPMDAAKISWVMYEHPEVDFSDMAMDFMDIRKRVIAFPKMGNKSMLVCVPTTAGTGSEVTPFAIITDQRDGTKYPITDYELMPSMAIIDSDLMLNIPKGLTRASGIDALTHCMEAYASMYASPFSDACAKEGISEIFKYLSRAYHNGGADPEAREHMAHAATLAGMAFANAFLGIDHSCGHKLGAYHHLPHGVCVELMLDEVMKFNAGEEPTKMGTFPQYQYPHTLARYVEIADMLGITGKNDDEKFAKLLAKIDDLKKDIELPLTIQEAGIKEEDFLKTLDEMSLAAFNDQCTSANPRYPLVSELKTLYLKAFYGEKVYNERIAGAK